MNPPAPSPLQDKAILLVEDNPLNLELAMDLLKLAGARVLPATNAEAALEIARQECPDLVLMDVSLPCMDGLAATRALRRWPAMARVPIVALTAHAMPGDRERILAAGCTGCLTKPLDTRTFAQELAHHLAPAPPAAASAQVFP